MPRIADIVVDVDSRQVDQLFSYRIDPVIRDAIVPGVRVVVPFGRQTRVGVVVSVRDEEVLDEKKLRGIEAVIDDEPILQSWQLKLVDWLCYRYACTRLQAIQLMLPASLRTHVEVVYQMADSTQLKALEQYADLASFLAKKPRTRKEIVDKFGTRYSRQIDALVENGAILRQSKLEEGSSAKTERWLERTSAAQDVLELAEMRERRAPRQAELLRALAGAERIPLTGTSWTGSVINAITDLDVAKVVEVEVSRSPLSHHLTATVSEMPTLTAWQERARARLHRAIESRNFHSYVLHGVTGSGKTEVYLRTIASTLAQKRGAIMLVPEISLTPQLVGRFADRFGDQIAVLHSGLSKGERRDEWMRIYRGEAPIVIGARSAVFAPVKHVGVILVDEEHEPSYKQEENPRYDARQVAVEVAKLHGAVVVSGSATPSLVGMEEVRRGQAELLTMPVRANGQLLPPVTLVDMREELRGGNRSIFSRSLIDVMTNTMNKGEQAVLFLNRRGYASFVLCRNCGETMECPNCDITLTLHQSRDALLSCHYCEYRQPYSSVCPNCQEEALRPFGVGTEQVELVAKELWPKARILRMDVDTTRRKGSQKELIELFQNGQADILIGTQMVAKGLDFPRVTLVGVVAADLTLAVPDYRGAERTFQLLTQVAGRAGRAELAGQTIVQTFQPDNYAIAASATHDYATFYEHERSIREHFTYPPFCELAVLLATHATESYAAGCAARFERELHRRGQGLKMAVLPAVKSGIGRIENKFRYQVVIKYEAWDQVRDAVVSAWNLVNKKMYEIGGQCTLDVSAGRI